MKHLHSPWRSAYIGTFKDEEKRTPDCLFCGMEREKSDKKNLVAWRGKTCFVVLNRYPYNSGHIMIVPKRHLGSFEALSDREHAEIMATTKKCIQALNKISKPHGYNFGSNLGRVAGAGIADHIHFHLVPRWNGDTNFMPVLSDIKVVSENLETLRDELEIALKRPKGTGKSRRQKKR